MSPPITTASDIAKIAESNFCKCIVIELGYMAKRIAAKTDWLKVPHVRDIWAVSNCISADFCNDITCWKHNGFWFFDSLALLRSVAVENGVDLNGCELVYYQGYDFQFNADENAWKPYFPDADRPTSVEPPPSMQCLGYDVVTYSQQNTPECSPLSCNHVATDVRVNDHCLIDSLDDAIDQLESGIFNNSEPGPFRIIVVNSIASLDGPAHSAV